MQHPDNNTASKITFIILFALVFFLAIQIVSSFMIAIIVGGLLALALRPLQKKLMCKRISSNLAAYLVFFILIVIVIVPLGLFIKSLIEQASMLKHYLASNEISYKSVLESIGNWRITKYIISNPAELESQMKMWLAKFGSTVSSFALNQASQIPTLILQTVFILLSFLFFLLDGKRFSVYISQKIPLREDIKEKLLISFKSSSKTAIWATLLTATVQACIIFFSFLALHVPIAFFAAASTFIFAFIPFVGSIPVWGLATLYLYLQGSITQMFVMIIVGVIVGLVDNVIRAFIFKGPKGLHPLIALIAVLGGIQVFGFFGVLIGPVIATLLITLCSAFPHLWEN